MVAYRRLLAVFGNGQHGRLGLASVASQLYPAICTPLQHVNVASVACGGGHTVVLAGAPPHPAPLWARRCVWC
jgi:alpha-tubulin suppressor-like RCC1 family protein